MKNDFILLLTTLLAKASTAQFSTNDIDGIPQTSVTVFLPAPVNGSNAAISTEPDPLAGNLVQEQGKSSPTMVQYPMLSNSIDRKVDPCDDFYSFVCNGWKRDHPIASEKFELGQTDILKDLVTAQIKGILREKPQNPSREEGLMYALYNKCLDAQNREDPSAIRLLFDRMRRMRDGGAQYLTDWLILMQPSDVFFDVSVGADERNSTRNVIQISPSSPFMNYNSYFDPAYAAEYVSMRDSLYQILILLGRNDYFGEFFTLFPLENWRRVEFFLRFDSTLSKIIQETEFNTQTQLITLDELQKTVGVINWRRYFAAVIPSDLDIDIGNVTIRIDNLAAVQRIQDAVSNANAQVVLDYLNWKIIFHFIDYLGKQFENIMTVFNQRVYGVSKDNDQESQCVDLVSTVFGDIISALYMKRHFDNNSVPLVKEMVENIRNSFIELLNDNEWMADVTKQKARIKANAIREFIGSGGNVFNETAIEKKYSRLAYTSNETYYDISETIALWMKRTMYQRLNELNDKKTFDVPAVEVNAFYEPNQNQIAILAGILRTPFFNASLPKLINYAAIGVVVGHEITHGFDDTGSMFDENGNRKNWWDEQTMSNFEKRTSCVEKQYGAISVSDLNVNIDGRRTEGENIADNGGMRSAINAATKFINSSDSNFVIENLTDYSPMQYFFMSYALLWCGNTRPQTELNNLANDAHAPGVYRVNTVLSNQPQFASAFQCRAGSKMNPTTKCTVW